MSSLIEKLEAAKIGGAHGKYNCVRNDDIDRCIAIVRQHEAEQIKLSHPCPACQQGIKGECGYHCFHTGAAGAGSSEPVTPCNANGYVVNLVAKEIWAENGGLESVFDKISERGLREGNIAKATCIRQAKAAIAVMYKAGDAVAGNGFQFGTGEDSRGSNPAPAPDVQSLNATTQGVQNDDTIEHMGDGSATIALVSDGAIPPTTPARTEMSDVDMDSVIKALVRDIEEDTLPAGDFSPQYKVLGINWIRGAIERHLRPLQIAKPQPVSVSHCAKALKSKVPYPAQTPAKNAVKAVLDAAGVLYVE